MLINPEQRPESGGGIVVPYHLADAIFRGPGT